MMIFAHKQNSMKQHVKRLIDCFDENGGIDPVQLLHYQRLRRKSFLQGLQDINGTRLQVLYQPSNDTMYSQLPHPKKGKHAKRGQAC